MVDLGAASSGPNQARILGQLTLVDWEKAYRRSARGVAMRDRFVQRHQR